jgi:transaldolase
LDDISTEGMELIEQIKTILDNYGYDTEIIVASVRHPLHVLDAALIGADIATVPFKVLKQLFSHPLTVAESIVSNKITRKFRNGEGSLTSSFCGP